MKRIVTCAALAVAMMSASFACAADQVSHGTLAKMGLSQMSSMSDSEGLAIRGKGTSASVWGNSSASLPGQASDNHYTAGSSHKHSSSLAVGASVSVAGAAVGSGRHVGFIVVGAGGGAIAYAK